MVDMNIFVAKMYLYLFIYLKNENKIKKIEMIFTIYEICNIYVTCDSTYFEP